MVAGKVKAVLGFHRSPTTPKQQLQNKVMKNPLPSPSPTRQPPSIADLLRTIHELQQRESRYQTELLEYKIAKETASLVPSLEKENGRLNQTVLQLEVKNEALRVEVDRLRSMVRTVEEEKKIRDMEAEIVFLKKTIVEQSRSSSSQAARVNAADLRLPRLKLVVGRGGLCEEERQVESMAEEIISRNPRIPKPPPIPSSLSSFSICGDESKPPMSVPPPPLLGLKSKVPTIAGRTMTMTSAALPPQPPPPPPPPPPNVLMGMKSGVERVRRVPEVVEFYHSLMRRDSRRDSGAVILDTPSSAANTKNMIGEIENRSTHLLAIKTDVETQGDFIRFLIKEVENAAFTSIEDVVAFVKWLDDELSFLVDERAVLKHFDWPEKKADAMREAAFGYNDLKKLELEASSSFQLKDFHHCSLTLKKMQTLLEKLEHGVYNISRVRESAIKRYRGFRIPWEWMTENGIIGQIKLASVKLAMKYLKRVSAELEAVGGGSLDEEELVLQGVRFAFRVHQFAGGFDVETMRAFQELRDKARSCKMQSQQQKPTYIHPHRLICRSTS